jgi:polyisoprenoid-binding protein YceI
MNSLRILTSILLALLAEGAAAAPQTEYQIVAGFPKHATVGIEFHDPSGAKWPNFFYGKPSTDSGLLRLDAARPEASFAVAFEQMAQAKGDQSRKVLGEWCGEGRLPAITLTVSEMGPLAESTAQKDKSRGAQQATLSGALEIGGRKTPVKWQATFRENDGKGDERRAAVFVDAKAAVPARDLGLKSLPAAAQVEIRFTLTAFAPQPAAPSPKKP